MRADLADWIALNMIRGIGPRTANQLIDRFGAPAQVFAASRMSLAREGIKPETIQELHDSEILERANAEIERLEQLGASVVQRLERWVVMQAPTGQRFCVVRVQRPGFPQGATTWA